MPVSRWLKELVEDGYLGRPYHLNLRYFADYGRSGKYMVFDRRGGRGIGGDLGSHWAYLARWYFGEIAAVTAVFGRALERGPRPDGATYDAAEDSATILLEFQSGATGSLHVSAVAHEPSPFGQLHQMELHGSRARSTRSATGIGSSASTAVVPASRRSTSRRSPTGSSTARGVTSSPTCTRTRSATTTSWPAGS